MCFYESARWFERDYRRRLPDRSGPADLLRRSVMVWPAAWRHPLRKRTSAYLCTNCFDVVGFAGAQFNYLPYSPVLLITGAFGLSTEVLDHLSDFDMLILRGVRSREVDGQQKGRKHNHRGGPEGCPQRAVAHVMRFLVKANEIGRAS